MRWGGLAGAVLLAVAAYLGGALPTLSGGPLAGRYGPWPVLAWLAGTALLTGAWWALRHGTPGTRWVLATVALWLLPLLVAPPLGSRDVYSYACQGWLYATGGDPYAVGPAGAGCPWVDAVAPIWRDTPAPYGPVFVALAGLATDLGGTLTGALVVLRLLALAGVLLTAACLPELARRCGVGPQRAHWLVLACPLVGVHLVSGAHNDAVMLGLLAAALLLVVRHPGRPGPLLAGGALLGLAVAVKATAIVVLPFAALAGLAGLYRPRRLAADGAWVVAGTGAALVAATGLSGLGPGWVGALTSSGDSKQWTSPPTAVGLVIDYAGRLVGRDPDAVPVTRAVAVVLLALLIVVLFWRAWVRLRGVGTAVDQVGRLGPGRNRVARLDAARPRVALTGAGLALTATVVLAPVFHPWYATWPLLLLAVTMTRTDWFLLPCAVAAFLVLPDGTSLARYTKAPGAILMTALLTLLLLVLVRKGPLLTHSVEEGPPINT
ncbi:DUF2029 domain-containing protein [Micromonospora echinofusca]|uniref:DUF2029 domain-containing protein n=1 Tax=Micromonospora echinofusca TaxID=47858 RepID=A0ABS3VLK9_MICEH|nr:DUF2029 domain-containing protein [Micromonospora echinofusca]